MLIRFVLASLCLILIYTLTAIQVRFPMRVAAVSGNSSTRSAQVKQLQDNKTKLNTETTSKSGTRTSLTEQRCSEAQSKIAEQIKKFDGMKSEHDARYARYVKKLEALITKLTAEGVSTTDLQQDKETLISLTAELTTALSLYADKVELAQQLAPNCGTTQGEFKSALQAAWAQMQVVRTKAQAIRAFMSGTLKDDLYAARQEMVALKKAASPKPTISPKLSSSPKPKFSPIPSPTNAPTPIQ